MRLIAVKEKNELQLVKGEVSRLSQTNSVSEEPYLSASPIVYDSIKIVCAKSGCNIATTIHFRFNTLYYLIETDTAIIEETAT